MIKKLLILFILLSSIAFADLSDYPAPFVENNLYNKLTVVIGAGDIPFNSLVATEIILGTPTNKGDSSSLLDTQVSNLNRNMIIVGTPCTNMFTSRFLETKDCTSGLKPGEGLIKLVKNNDYSALIVTGYGKDEIKNAGEIMKHYPDYTLKGDTLLVKGQELQEYNYVPPVEKVIEQPQIIEECKTVGEIVTNKYYCNSDKKLIALKELDRQCVNSYECKNQNCYNGLCYQNFFSRLWDWIKSLF